MKGVEDGITDEQTVRMVYPDMVVTRYPLTKVNGCIVWECADPFSKVLGRGNTKAEALSDARAKLPKPATCPSCPDCGSLIRCTLECLHEWHDVVPLRSATPEELTAQAESRGANYKPGPRQATPFMPTLRCPCDWGEPEDCTLHPKAESPEESPSLRAALLAIMPHLNELPTETCHRLAPIAHAALSPTLPVPERTAEMEELMASLRAAAEKTPYQRWEHKDGVIVGADGHNLFIGHWATLLEGNFIGQASPENILKLLDHFAKVSPNEISHT